MPRKRVRLNRDVDTIIHSARRWLSKLSGPPAATKKELNDTVATFVALSHDIRELSLHHSQNLLSLDSASERILDYFRLNVGEPIEGEAIDIVSTISEYPRRIREWRVEFGFPIPHKAHKYTLTSLEPDAAKAELWRTMNRIRRLQFGEKKAGEKRKALELFKAFPNQILTTAQLKYVMITGEMRRVRELRGEEGWRIYTRNTGRPDLGKTEYILVDSERLPEHDRVIKDTVYSKVLERDNHRCQKKDCGWHPKDKVAGDRKQYIEVHHITWVSKKGENNLGNLITLCNVHHRDLHRDKIGPDQFPEWLKVS